MGSKNYISKFSVGDVAGKWTIVSHVEKTKYGQYSVLARCSCGIEKIVSEYSLFVGTSKSCRNCSGPKGVDSIGRGRDDKGDLISAWNNYLYRYNRTASQRGILFELSMVEFKSLCRGNCTYCGSIGANKDFGTNKTLSLVNGIDRVESKRGYTIDNCVSCCKICNWMKSNLSREDFLSHISKIYNYYGGQ